MPLSDDSLKHWKEWLAKFDTYGYTFKPKDLQEISEMIERLEAAGK